MAAQVLYTLQPTGIQGVAFTVEPAAVRHPGRGSGHLRGESRLAVRGLRPDSPGRGRLPLHRARQQGAVTPSIVRPRPDTPGARSAGCRVAGRSTSWPCRRRRRHRGRHRRRHGAAPGRGRRRSGPYGPHGVTRPAAARVHPVRRAVGGRSHPGTAGSSSGSSGTDRVASIDSTILSRGTIKAFAISPDGVRMALIREVDGRYGAGSGPDHPWRADPARRLAVPWTSPAPPPPI